MGLHHADDFLEAMANERKCYIGGRVRSGKTLLSFVLADFMIKNDLAVGVWANIPHSLPEAESVQDAVIIIDEAGQFASSHTDYATVHDMYARWAGKTNSIYLFPSVDKVQANLRNLECLRVWDIDLLPIRMWIYQWYYSLGASGWFILTNPEDYFGIYDTLAVPSSDGGVLENICSLYPEAVVEILENKKGVSQISKILEKYGYLTQSKNNRNGSVPVDQSRIVELTERVYRLELELAKLLGVNPSNIKSAASATPANPSPQNGNGRGKSSQT